MTDINSAPLPTSDDMRQLERQTEIRRCLVELRSSNPYHRSQAARRLGEMRAEADALLEALGDPNSFVRSAAAEALGHMPGEPTEEMVGVLLSAIDDPNDYVCAAAVNSLGLLRAVQAADQVIACLDDTNPFIVQAAVLALARLAPPGIDAKLAGYLDSDQYLIRLSATRAVGILNYQPAGERILQMLQDYIDAGDRQDLKLPKLLIDVLARLQVSEAVPQLVHIAQHEVGLRSAAVEALIELNAEESAPLLAPMLSDPSNKLRRHLVEMMIKADYRAALPIIRGLLKDPNIAIREAALAAVSRWNDTASIETVRWMCYHDSNPFVRPQAINTLFSLTGDAAEMDLLALSGDLNAHVRRAVAQNLGRFSALSDDAVAALNRLAYDPDAGETATQALTQHAFEVSAPPPEALIPQPRLVPEFLSGELDGLIARLETWQNSLSRQPGGRSMEEIARVDQALSLLLVALKDASHRAQTGQGDD